MFVTLMVNGMCFHYLKCNNAGGYLLFMCSAYYCWCAYPFKQHFFPNAVFHLLCAYDIIMRTLCMCLHCFIICAMVYDLK